MMLLFTLILVAAALWLYLSGWLGLDLTVTAANVATTADTVTTTGTAGEALTAGQAIHSESDGKWYLSDADGAAAKQALNGVALCSAPGAGQPIVIATGGSYKPGATLTVGLLYCMSSNPGGIAPSADIIAGWKVSLLGVATATDTLKLQIFNSGATR